MLKINKKKLAPPNFLDVVFCHNCQYECSDSGSVTLLTPRFRLNVLSRLARKMGKPELVRVKLDKNGSRLWLLLDGHRPVAQLIAAMTGIGDYTQERIIAFLTILLQNQFIRLA